MSRFVKFTWNLLNGKFRLCTQIHTMSLQKSLLENALNRATKEAEKLKIDDSPQPVDANEERRHQHLLESIDKKRKQVRQVQSVSLKNAKQMLKEHTFTLIYIAAPKTTEGSEFAS